MKALQLIFSSPRYFSPALLFATLNVVFGTWAIYIPRIKENIGISEGELGFAVFFIALGTLCTVGFVPKLVNRFGVGRLMVFAVMGYCISFIGPFAVNTYVLLCASLFVVGMFSGLMDVTMNTLVTEIEKEDGVHFMSVSHGFFSLGGMIGGGLGIFLIPILPSAFTHIITIVALMILINLFFIKNYRNIVAAPQVRETSFKLKSLRPLIGLGVIGILIMGAEGAIVDWSALYLEKVTLAAATLVGLGYTIFNGTMAFGRFFGDAVSARYGSRAIMLAGIAISSIGFGLILTTITWIAILGFALVGLGFSVVVPELFRYSGKLDGIASAEGVSFIAGTGFAGMLLGPVFLGFLAETFSLKSSFIALLCFSILAGIIASSLKRK